MEEEELKRMLGIHKLDHVDFFDKDSQEFFRVHYPGLEINVHNNIVPINPIALQSVYINAGITIVITWNGKKVSRDTGHVNNDLVREMMKELDPL